MDEIARIEAALAAGPTPGPWHHEEWGSKILDSGVGSSQLLIAQVAVNTFRDQGRHNADYIAACNPVAIRALLDRLKAAEAEASEQARLLGISGSVEARLLARVAELERAISDALPGVVYMDPPDGGSVSLGEQLRRMAVDADRYRWLRDNWFTLGATYYKDKFQLHTGCPRWSEQPESALDAEIDRARGAE
jgi:hypothetical protein